MPKLKLPSTYSSLRPLQALKLSWDTCSLQTNFLLMPKVAQSWLRKEAQGKDVEKVLF